jgi:signal transduction histidine kinase
VRPLEQQQTPRPRVAALVAAGAASADVFAAIAGEVAQVLRPRLVEIVRWERDGSVTVVGAWGHGPRAAVAREQLCSGGPFRAGLAAGAPIVLDGESWGHIGIAMEEGAPLPDGVEEQLAAITELVATAIASGATREQLVRLAEEQDALRRVATLVARGAPPAEVFDAVAGELGRLLEVGSSGLLRFESEHTATVVAGWGRLGEIVPVGARLPLGGANVVSEIARTGKPVRVDDFGRVGSGPIAEHARRLNTGSSTGAPLVVAGRLWGAIVVAALDDGSLPPDAQPRLEQFVELVGTAIANAEARVELARLADEQAALRRVATLVAEEVPAEVLFAKVGEEVARVLGPGIEAAIVPRDDDVPAEPVALTCPIVITGGVWGALVVTHRDGVPFPPDTERRVSQFAELVATAIANERARVELRRLAEEQAALHRVATLVAEAAPPPVVFDAVIVEVAQLLGAGLVGLMRAEGSDEVTIVANRGHDPAIVRAGMRMRLEGDSVTARVLRTGRSARIDLSREGAGQIADLGRRVMGTGGQTIGAPVTVEGRRWGVMTATWRAPNQPPPDVEERLVGFGQLLGTAIANADSRHQLTASRARVLTAGDEARRRVVRDLHDGAQQRLVHTIVTLKLARRTLKQDGARAAELLAEASSHAEQSNAELRELAHGILPSVLTHGGLRAGVDAVVSRLDLPVELSITGRRLSPEIEASAYFIVAEALTNVVKHAQASGARVTADIDDGTLRLEVSDDGIGGADIHGHGLLGIGDRVAALGGRMRIESPRGGGTLLTAELPLTPGSPAGW